MKWSLENATMVGLTQKIWEIQNQIVTTQRVKTNYTNPRSALTGRGYPNFSHRHLDGDEIIPYSVPI